MFIKIAILKYLSRSLHHFAAVEDQYNQWLVISRKKNLYDYPEIVLKPMKDDVVQIADHW